jgi:serine/threonine-protein kinase
MDADVGDVVDERYRIVGPLGEGGMGRVMLAEHVMIKRKVALKILHAHFADDATVLNRFMNEARAAGTLGHPNIVESTDMGVTKDGVPYIAFEYLEGSSLTDEIYRLNGLGVRRALRIAYQVAIALDAAHQAGVIHRDLKSDNIFLTDRDGRSDHVKVLDFGVSRFLESVEGGEQMVGTPEYMAPEQITNPDTVDVRTDVYGLGVILFEMIMGHCPFTGDDKTALLERVVAEAPPPIAAPNLPPGLSQLITTKLLAKDPAQRYPSMHAVASALEAFDGILAPASGRTPLSIRVPEPDLSLTQATTKAILLPPAPQRRGPSPLLAAAALVVAGGATAWFLNVPQPEAAKPAATASLQPTLAAAAVTLASTIESNVRAMELQVNGIASAPMLRAAIDTDAATLVDMAADQTIFTPRPGEVLEIFQLRPGSLASMIRIPTGAAALPALVGGKRELDLDGAGLRLVVSTPIRRQSAEVGGSAVFSTALPLDSTRSRLASLPVTLVGLAAPLRLGGETTDGEIVSVPVPVPTELGLPALKLEATLPSPAAAAPAAEVAGVHRVGPFALWGLGGLLFCWYAVSLILNRSRR